MVDSNQLIDQRTLSLIDRFKAEMKNRGYHPYCIAMTEAVDALTAAMVEICKTDCKIVEAVAELASSEISDDNLLRKIAQASLSADDFTGGRASHDDFAKAILKEIRPYLRTTGPVSVDIDKCAQAAFKAYKDCKVVAVWLMVAEAVLDAAGVKYE